MTNTSALQNVIDSLLNGKPVSLKLSVNAMPGGNGITFNGQVVPESPPVIDPLPIPPAPLPVPPPVTPPTPAPPPVVPPPVVSPPQFASVTHPMAVPPTLKTAFPYPTNAWWENIILGKNRIAPDPYHVQIVDNGFTACYPTQTFVQDNLGMQHITTQFLQNVSLEFAEHIGTWAVIAYDDLTVTLKWTASNGQTATTVIAQGSPYLSMAYSGTTPLLTTQHSIVSVTTPSGSILSSGSISGSKFKIVLNNGQTWILYSWLPLTLTCNGSQLIASSPLSGVIRLAVLTNAADEAILDTYAGAVPTGSRVSTSNGTYTFNWDVAGAGSLLMCALPHHMDILQSPQVVALSRRSIKGPMTGVVGSTWTLVEQLPTIQWTAPRPIDPNKLDAIKMQLKKDATFVSNSISDTYFAGKGLAKMARLLLIAAEVGDTDSIALIQKNLKASLSVWFDRRDLFGYEAVWGSIQFIPAGADKGANFGFNYGNDGHYHIGYFLYACSALAKLDAQWLATYKDKVTTLLHHYCNSDDTHFTPHRHKDIWSSHSWASGLFDFSDNRNQESVSEACSGYSAMALWGLVTNDLATQNFGALMLAMECRAAKRYYHTYPGNNVYSDKWTANGAGMIWQAAKIDDSTWFDAHLSCRRGIQVLPLTQFSHLWLEPSWVQAMKDSGELAKMLAENFTTWPTFVNALLAIVNPSDAWTVMTGQNVVDATGAIVYRGLQDSQIDDGASRTNLLWWVATRS